MAAEKSIIISELLCLVNCHSGISTNDQLSSVLLGFYNDGQIEKTEVVLHERNAKEDYNVDIGRLEIHQGANKRNIDMIDPLRMYATADLKKMLIQHL